jgi:hypothetical protein
LTVAEPNSKKKWLINKCEIVQGNRVLVMIMLSF